MALIIDDRLVTLNGAKMVAGAMLRTTTVAAKVVRLLLMWRGHWPGGNGRLIGNAAWARLQQAKDDKQTRADVMGDHEEALSPLVEDGSIHTVEVSTELSRKGRLWHISWLSKRGEPGDVVLTDPESLNR